VFYQYAKKLLSTAVLGIARNLNGINLIINICSEGI
jgi:hypothetical protein